jgi:hypothetical protein
VHGKAGHVAGTGDHPKGGMGQATAVGGIVHVAASPRRQG